MTKKYRLYAACGDFPFIQLLNSRYYFGIAFLGKRYYTLYCKQITFIVLFTTPYKIFYTPLIMSHRSPPMAHKLIGGLYTGYSFFYTKYSHLRGCSPTVCLHTDVKSA